MKRIYDILLAVLCLIIGTVIVILWYPDAESILVLLLFVAILLPTIPLTVIFELIHALTRHNQKAEKILLILDIIGTAWIGAFWIFMILVGGDEQILRALTVCGVNIVITSIVAVKGYLEKKCSPPA
ncbi:MAG: hypothetical protein K5695_04470 [Oscillospiraceae bacterium]|nr:hypothetical protein [Oscillospiraceae bacterium]